MRIKQLVLKMWRYPLCKYYQSKLKLRDFTIISSDCIGGCLYHDLGLQFNTPTINLTIPRSMEFFEALTYYMQINPVPNGYSSKGAPVMLLDDLEIVGVHYQDHNELINKWNERKKRINWDRIVIMTSSRFVRTAEEQERFAKLPYHKVLFNGEKTTNCCEAYAPSVALNKDMTAYCDLLGRRRFEKDLNCVQFLNGCAQNFCAGGTVNKEK